MKFTIQYFATHDRLFHVESINADQLSEALERARFTLKHLPLLENEPPIIGYVILDDTGRQVARGYKRD
jgi:hypothetical protein